jgi:hypothetical protein
MTRIYRGQILLAGALLVACSGDVTTGPTSTAGSLR